MNCTREPAFGYGPRTPLAGAAPPGESPATPATRSIRWRASHTRPPRTDHRESEESP